MDTKTTATDDDTKTTANVKHAPFHTVPSPLVHCCRSVLVGISLVVRTLLLAGL